MNTGMIGLGAMGMNMARRLAEAGYLTAIYNRTTSKAQTLANELNVKVCMSPEQLADEVDLILICVSADQDVLAMIHAICQTIKAHTIVVDLSTVSSETAKTAAALLALKQAHFLDAPVSGGVEGAKHGALSMMVGGDEDVLNKIKPVLSCMATRITHMGNTGAGQATKAVNQVMAAGINQAVTEALAFAQAQQLPMAKVIEVTSAGAAGNWFLQHRGLTMSQGIFQPGFKVALHHKDLTICLKMAEAINFELPISAKTFADYSELISKNFSDEDISALYRIKHKQIPNR